jgi:hypothetical protein
MIGCACNVGLSNTGRPNCVPLFSVVSSLIVVPLKDINGDYNEIDLTTPYTASTWEALVNATDPSQRWFPLPAFENVELPKADSQFEEANSGRMAFLRQGKRSFAGELWANDSTPTFLGKIQNVRCVSIGIYIVDINGNLIGSKVGNVLRPIPVDNASWDPRFMFATDSTVQKIMLGFDFDRLFDESTMYLINPEEADQNFNDLTGLIDVNFTNTSATTTSVTFTADLIYGTAPNPLLYIGAALGDWDLESNGVSVGAPLTISEVPEGTYTLTFAALTVGDVLTVNVDRLGYDGEFSITI